MKCIRNFCFVLLLLVFQNVFAGNGLLFNVTDSGAAGQVNINLCLNGKGPISCQNFNVSALTLNICAVPTHTYSQAGIKVNTPGYAVANLGATCEPIGNGYCLFSVSNTTCKQLTLQNTNILTLSPPSLPAGQLSTPYNATISATGGVEPYTFAVTSGSLPLGLALNSSTGVISGTPTSDGTYAFTITASDTNSSVTGSMAYSIVISGSLTVSPSSLPAGQLSTAYNATISASGGVGPYTFAVTSGTLPAGLTLNSTTGVISGTPTIIGIYNFTITSTDTNSSDTGSRGYSVVVSSSLTVNPNTLPAGQLSTAYNATISASGGVGPYTFAVTAGTFPAGLTLNSATGVISGTPTIVGTYNFTITASDTNSIDTGSRAYSVVISGSLTVSPTTLPAGTRNNAYSAQLSASGGIGPYTFAVTSGGLPSGLTLSSGGLVSGTPTTDGSFTFTLTASDTNSVDTGSRAYTISITGALTLSPSTLPPGTVGTPYNATITASGGVPPYAYALSQSDPNAGLSINPVTGQITGTPLAIGSYSVTVSAVDSNSTPDTGITVYTFTVN